MRQGRLFNEEKRKTGRLPAPITTGGFVYEEVNPDAFAKAKIL
jgi:hypothetical protein